MESSSSLLENLRLVSVLLDTHGRILLWSPPAQEVLGWNADEVVGRYFDTLIHPAGDESTREQARRICSTVLREARWRGLLHVRHRDGPPVQLQGSAFLLSGADTTPAVAATLVEADRLHTVARDLAGFDALFASSPLGIGFFDTELRYVRVNESLAELNGLPVSAHLGRTVHETLPSGMADEIHQVQAAVLDTGRTVVDLVMTAPDQVGARSISYSRLSDHLGNVLGVTCTVMDITERRDALQKVERARQRLALLDHVGVALGDLLDVRPIAQSLATALVPRFCDYSGVMLLGAVAHGGELPGSDARSGAPLLQLGAAAKDRGPAVERMLHVGQDIAFQPDSFFARTLETGVPHLAASRRDLIDATYPGDPKVQAAMDLDIHSMLTVPLRARGIVLGLLVISRAGEREAFDNDDLVLTMEIADRAGTSLDNARLYAREREGALMLQRSLLPQHVPSPPGVRVAYRYVPGSSGTEVGGDWFDVVPLAGGRVAFVVGDVMGHGLRAAATMGRLRTAVRTLAGLDLPPDELLRRVNDLADDLAQGPEDPLMATCLYAVYDPSTRRCTLARAGHLPPLLLTPREGGGWQGRTLDIPSGAPLGVGGVDFESAELQTDEASVLVLYTDGLVENRGEDITEGVDRLLALLTSRSRSGPAEEGTPSLEDACDTAIATLRGDAAAGGSRSASGGAGLEGGPGFDGGPAFTGGPAVDGGTWPGTRSGYGSGHDGSHGRGARESEDDVALLMAQFGGLPEGSAASWTFSAGSYAVRRARAVVRDTLVEWGLGDIVDEAVLLVSELVTNSLRYAHGPIGVRMVRGSSLLVEVSDPLPDPPRPRTATEEDEGGRGIQLVAVESRRWGTRHGPMGKTVWFELALPG